MVIVGKDTSHTLKSIFYPEYPKENLKNEIDEGGNNEFGGIQTFNIEISIDFKDILCNTKSMFKVPGGGILQNFLIIE
jgi:hypothetical protein